MCNLESLLLEAEVEVETFVKINSRETQIKPTKAWQRDTSLP